MSAAQLQLAYCPRQSGYSVQRGSTVISQALDGGLPRNRKDIKRASHTVQVNWVVKKGGFEYLNAFYNVWSDNPSLPFKALLKIDSGRMEEYECYFADGMPPELMSIDGPIYNISAMFTVKALPRVRDWEDLVIELKQEDAYDFTNLLEHIVNVVMPEKFK